LLRIDAFQITFRVNGTRIAESVAIDGSRHGANMKSGSQS